MTSHTLHTLVSLLAIYLLLFFSFPNPLTPLNSSLHNRLMEKMCDCCESKRYWLLVFSFGDWFALIVSIFLFVKHDGDVVHCFILWFVRLASLTSLWKEALTPRWESWWCRQCTKVVLQINTVSAWQLSQIEMVHVNQVVALQQLRFVHY